MKNILIILFAGFALSLFSGCSESNAGFESGFENNNNKNDDVKTYSKPIPVTQNRGIIKRNMVIENKAYSANRGR